MDYVIAFVAGLVIGVVGMVLLVKKAQTYIVPKF